MAVEAASARAPYAADPARSRGRRHAEAAGDARSAFRRDCDRIIHASAFRRLAHKTQVFVFHEGDHYRTRLTHTLEVTQIARALARALGLDEDLAEALALAHDLGHPPFGHAGERALDEAMSAYGGFDHNAQTLRVVTQLERRYPDFNGFEPDLGDAGRHRQAQWSPHSAQRGAAGALPRVWHPDRHPRIRGAARPRTLEFCQRRSQVAAIADDIAYNAHDIDDGLRADLFKLDDVSDVRIVRTLVRSIRAEHPTLEPERLVHELVRRLIAALVEDVFAESQIRLTSLAPGSADDIRRARERVVGFSAAMASAEQAIKAFLYPRMYRHPRVAGIMDDATQVVRDLVAHYAERPQDMPEGWTQGLDPADRTGRMRRIADFVAGMTDRYALLDHSRHFDSTPELR